MRIFGLYLLIFSKNEKFKKSGFPMMLVQRHLLSDDTKNNACSVIPWLNLVRCRRGECSALIERNSLDHIYIFQSETGIHSFK